MNIKDYLKYYIGCRVLADDKDLGTFIGADLVPNEVGNIYYNIHLDEWPEGEIMPFNDDMSEDCRIKPILRRLEDMTEEEICKMALAGGLIGTPTRANIEGSFIQMEYVKDGEILVEHWHPNELNAGHFHFLLSRGFDLFGLCDAGLAIDSKTVTTNE